MAIACRICGKSLQALASGRCRKCRRLICRDCVGSGAFQAADGFLCRECLAHGPAEPESPQAINLPQGNVAGASWLWMAASLILAAAFTILVSYPYLRAAYWQRALQADNAENRSAAGRALGEIGDGPSLRILRETADMGNTLSRVAAVEGLGWCRHPAAADILRQLAGDAAAPEIVRLAAQESLCRHNQMRKLSAPQTSQ